METKEYESKFELNFKDDNIKIKYKFEEETMENVLEHVCRFLSSIGYSDEVIGKYIPEYPFY